MAEVGKIPLATSRASHIDRIRSFVSSTVLVNTTEESALRARAGQ